MSDTENIAIRRFTFLLRNSLEEQLTLRIEPWGDETGIPPGMTFEVRAEGPASGQPLVEITESAVVIYGWTNSTVDAEPAD